MPTLRRKRLSNRYSLAEVAQIVSIQQQQEHRAQARSHNALPVDGVTVPQLIVPQPHRHQLQAIEPNHFGPATPEQPVNSFSMNMRQKRASVRRSIKMSPSPHVNRLSYRSKGPDIHHQLKQSMGDLIHDVEHDLQSPYDQRTAVIDLGGLELPMEEGELNRAERLYLHCAEQGDLSTLKELIDRADELKLNFNCMDALGRDALRIVIENEHLEALELLVTVPQIELGDSLLHAINEDNVTAVEVILHAQAERSSRKNLKFRYLFANFISPVAMMPLVFRDID
ncbi:unnamed protein product [Echinostoma caproni]|uniref:ANK_REP_REGION domain-containing protein n=1 Tax=Echinostoma caproni TaxID=27848 RepID=A0A183AND7_9TREM|nr:unnamed protein product [Echinostoma caproni]